MLWVRIACDGADPKSGKTFAVIFVGSVKLQSVKHIKIIWSSNG